MTTALEITVAVLGIVMTIGGIVAAAWAVARVKGVEKSISILNEANHGLRSANADLNQRLIDSERACHDKISELRGQNQALMHSLGESIVTSISDHLETALDRIVTRAIQRLESVK